MQVLLQVYQTRVKDINHPIKRELVLSLAHALLLFLLVSLRVSKPQSADLWLLLVSGVHATIRSQNACDEQHVHDQDQQRQEHRACAHGATLRRWCFSTRATSAGVMPLGTEVLRLLFLFGFVGSSKGTNSAFFSSVSMFRLFSSFFQRILEERKKEFGGQERGCGTCSTGRG
jgi:hypothetical protein